MTAVAPIRSSVPLATLAASPAFAQGAAPTPLAPRVEPSDHCPGLVATRPPFRSLIQRIALNRDEVRFTYIGHSTFLIESPQLVRIATDYNGYIKPPMIPDIVTMNHAHSTHYTDHPEPEIRHVLRGWAGNERPARIDVNFKDVTYETLNREDFLESVQKAFPNVDWDKAYSEFKAAGESRPVRENE